MPIKLDCCCEWETTIE